MAVGWIGPNIMQVSGLYGMVDGSLSLLSMGDASNYSPDFPGEEPWQQYVADGILHGALFTCVECLIVRYFRDFFSSLHPTL